MLRLVLAKYWHWKVYFKQFLLHDILTFYGHEAVLKICTINIDFIWIMLCFNRPFPLIWYGQVYVESLIHKFNYKFVQTHTVGSVTWPSQNNVKKID